MQCPELSLLHLVLSDHGVAPKCVSDADALCAAIRSEISSKSHTSSFVSHEKLSLFVDNIILQSKNFGQRLGHGYVGTEHVLYVLANDERLCTASFLKEKGVTSAGVEGRVLEVIYFGA